MALVLLVGCGGFLGSVSRFLVGSVISRISAAEILHSTIIINLLGSFIVGFALPAFESRTSSPYFFFLVPGFLGGFTTYSAFSAETVSLLERHLYWQALSYVLISLVGGLLLCGLGMLLSKQMLESAMR